MFAFLLLLVTFRSIVIAVKAVVLNLLSVGAAYGVLVTPCSSGVGARPRSASSSNGGIASWLPIFMFVILFGLSMDYHVFILSRDPRGVRPRHEDRGRSRARHQDHGRHGVQRGARHGRRVRIFAMLPILDLKEMGIGLAVAVLIDATIVRAVLLPATMKLLGDWNWYLPRWLEWLPKLEHERSADEHTGAPVPQPA